MFRPFNKIVCYYWEHENDKVKVAVYILDYYNFKGQICILQVNTSNHAAFMMNVVTRFGRQLLDNQTEKGVIYVRENIGKKFVFYHMGLIWD